MIKYTRPTVLTICLATIANILAMDTHKSPKKITLVQPAIERLWGHERKTVPGDKIKNTRSSTQHNPFRGTPSQELYVTLKEYRETGDPEMLSTFFKNKTLDVCPGENLIHNILFSVKKHDNATLKNEMFEFFLQFKTMHNSILYYAIHFADIHLISQLIHNDFPVLPRDLLQAVSRAGSLRAQGSDQENVLAYLTGHIACTNKTDQFITKELVHKLVRMDRLDVLQNLLSSDITDCPKKLYVLSLVSEGRPTTDPLMKELPDFF